MDASPTQIIRPVRQYVSSAILFDHSAQIQADLDPTKLTKSRQFNRSAAPSSSKKDDYSLWTETPAEKQQRLADEVSGKRRRATNVEDTVSPEEAAEARKRRKLDEEIRQGVSSHTVRIVVHLIS